MKSRFSWDGYSDDPEERRLEVRSQIRSKRLHKAAVKEARLDLKSSRESVYKRSVDEYRRPAQELRMSTWDTARSIPIHDDRSFEERPLTWMGVRGTLYANPQQWFYAPGQWVEAWGELVPEPFNPHDEFALAIDLNETRLGYASASYARHAHGYVSTLNNLGNRVMVPLKYRSDYDRELRLLIARGFAALPTFSAFSKLLPDDEEYAELLGPVWEALREEVRIEIARDRFHLTERTLAEIVALRHFAPGAGIPDVPRLQAIPRGMDYFLKQRRIDEHRAAERERKLRDKRIIAAFEDGWRQVDVAKQLGVSTSVVNRVLKVSGVDTRSPRMNPEQRQIHKEIVRLVRDGRTRREISEALGVSTYAVTKAAADAGITARSEAGVNDYARAKMKERLGLCLRANELKRSGRTRKEVARKLAVSDDSAKNYLADGKFFNDPNSNPDRLSAARAARINGMTQSQASDRYERRAIRDANMLDLIGQQWT